MEYFKSGLKSVLGAQQPEAQPTGADIVEKLVDRVTLSTLLEDRRDACRALKALSKKYRIEVGAQGMDALRQILETDRADCEIIGYALDTLCNVTSPERFDEEEEHNNVHVNINIGEQFTEMFIKKPDSVTMVLNFLEEYDFRVRWATVRLLTSLLANRPKEIQDIVLISPMGVSRLMDLLLDSREIIRNDALLLLLQLTKSNANIQKIVAFENAFDRLFDVVKEEGYTDGGIVVEDCLLLMLNLLKNNTSNINFFKEGSFIQRMAPMLEIPENNKEVGWSPQKVSNIHCVFQLIRALVSPNNSVQITSSCQRNLRIANILEALCHILMADGVPDDIISEAINTVGEVIRGNLNNQEYFANVIVSSNPPLPVMIVLLMSMINEKQPFALRCAVLYCFQCFLYKNEIGQQQIVQTLLPSTSNTDTVTTGQLLCRGLFSPDPSNNWFSAVALSHTLIDNAAQKEQMLRVLLATNVGSQPFSLLQQCSTFVQQAPKLQSKLGMLMLLATWMSNCSAAVKMFLGVPGAMAFLTAQTSATEFDNNEELLQGLCSFLMGICVVYNDNSVQNYSKENLLQLIERRVGLETYVSKLTEVSRHEVYARSAKQPQIKAKHSSELLLEFEFCKLFKALEGMIIQTLGAQKQLANGMTELSLSEQENGLLLQYKVLIREQDNSMKNLNMEIGKLKEENGNLKSQLEEVLQTNAQLRDQNTLLTAQLAAVGENREIPQPKQSSTTTVACTQSETSLSENAIAVLEDKIKRLEAENEEKADELEKVRRDQEDLLELLTDQDSKLRRYKARLRELGEQIDDGDSDLNSGDEVED